MIEAVYFCMQQAGSCLEGQKGSWGCIEPGPPEHITLQSGLVMIGEPQDDLFRRKSTTTRMLSDLASELKCCAVACQLSV